MGGWEDNTVRLNRQVRAEISEMPWYEVFIYQWLKCITHDGTPYAHLFTYSSHVIVYSISKH